MTDLNGFFAALTSFERDPHPELPPGANWEEIVPLLEWHGLGAIASYQLDYKFLAKLRPPQWVRERLQMTFNGCVNDNVLKVTQLRRLLSEDGMPELVLLGDAALADALYPHIAFRPMQDLDLWVQPDALAGAQAALGEGGLRPATLEGASGSRPLAARLANPDIGIQIWRAPPGLALSESAAKALWAAKVPARAYGPAAHRLAPADAFCARLAALALSGFAVPRILLVDLREMVLRCALPTAANASGEPAKQPDGFYEPSGQLLRAEDVRERARALGLTRALFAGTTIIAELFPEARAQALALTPALPARIAALLRQAVVKPALDLRRTKVVRAMQSLRALLLR